MRKNKILLPAAFLFAAISSAFAQGNGIAGITEATNMVTSYFLSTCHCIQIQYLACEVKT